MSCQKHAKAKWDLPINSQRAVSLDPDAYKVVLNTNVQSEHKLDHELLSNPSTDTSNSMGALVDETYTVASTLVIASDAFVESIGNLTLDNKALNSRLGKSHHLT